ncbi:adenine phosphoribosyltransferase [[Kitasatospora] papulosa]|uniref:adenine phosphoribosyltransferase n=1 Tax=[Kitasatospora] papulosa TaxID=1464011 RepID=UPI00367ED5CD
MESTGTAAEETLSLQERLLARIRNVPDFPKQGVTFKDITPLLADAEVFSRLVDELADLAVLHEATVVAGLEARGFILAAPVALRAGVGFVPVRKAGKLPGPTLVQSYELEYGNAEVEVQCDAFAPGSRVLVVDDVLATGGTLEASIRLIRDAGAEVVAVGVLMELGFLEGRKSLQPLLDGVPLEAVVAI